MKLPEQLTESLRGTEGYDERDFVEAHQHAPATSVRKHILKVTDSFDDCEQVSWCKEGRYLDKRPVFTLDPLFHAGAYYVQEASSMFLDYILRSVAHSQTGLRILDLCAAPGGKSTLIASTLEKESLLISNEVIRSRVPVLEENISRWGYMNTWVTSNDAAEFGKLAGYFDIIVADVPCSGSGLFRKDANAIHEWSPSNVVLCSQRQKRILADSWNALKKGGFLIYSTCSYSTEEDEDIIDWIAGVFKVSSGELSIPAEWGIVTTYSPKYRMQGFRFFPHRLKGEGFFIAAIKKEEEAGNISIPKVTERHEKNIRKECSFLLGDDDWVCVPAKEGYAAINPDHRADLELLKKALYLHTSGVCLGSRGAKEWLPHHDAALSIDRAADLPAISLDRENALRYLKKEEIAIPVPGKGWYLATYEKQAMGWVKSLGNRFNNYLPKNLRIRMDIGV